VSRSPDERSDIRDAEISPDIAALIRATTECNGIGKCPSSIDVYFGATYKDGAFVKQEG